MTDEMLSVLVCFGPLLHTLVVDQVCLESDQHAAANSPWTCLVTSTLNIADVAKIPHPMHTPEDIKRKQISNSVVRVHEVIIDRSVLQVSDHAQFLGHAQYTAEKIKW